ncbi:DUF3180 domain-containing protein [Nakamurella silvestris]|nr:DUF3180 domain-containing protein [Nakamurella silvestris]
MGVTRLRDLAAVAVVAAVLAYLLTRWNYNRMPALPRLAGLTAALLGIGEAIAGTAIRLRLRGGGRDHGGRPALRPIQPLVAVRALMVGKATALAGAGIAGLWAGLLLYVAPSSSTVVAAGDDTLTAVLGLVGAAVMILGALWLENCCRAPESPDDPHGPVG